SVYFSFFFQPLGLSSDFETTSDLDSLLLEFFMPEENGGQGLWQRVWGRKQGPSTDFEQVMVRIVDYRFLKNGFRFRFLSKASLGGAVDQWHIDYVRLGRNRSYTDTQLDDVAFVYPEQSLLLRYTSVPYVKFANAPAAFMSPSITVKQRNLSTTDRFITWGYRSGPEAGPLADFVGGNNISGNAQTIFNSTFPVNSAPNNYQYDVSGSPEVAYLRTKLWTQATPDGCRYNDTLSFVQELSNYYSYDDGTAEWGYYIQGADLPKKLAYRFDSDGGDSLRAVRIYFTPIFTYDLPNDPRDGNFLITVWSSVQPENIVFQNVSFSTPEYRQWGPNYYVEYPLDSAIWVQGTFYVGLVQTNNVNLYLGVDRNRVNNDRMFYNAGTTNWSASSVQGSWMIRPVVTSPQDPFAGVDEPVVPGRLGIFPNPAGELFRLEGEDLEPGASIELFDAMGRAVRQWRYDGGPLPVHDLAPGLYVVRASDRGGRVRATGRLMVQHG
ncbi:MAG TPA: T9SS type A sorting domain-containing protein, partial [Flavobacteriales bacterium]